MPIISRTSDVYLKDKQKWVSVLQERWLSIVKKVGAEERQGRALQPWEGRGEKGREGERTYVLDQTRQPPSALKWQLLHAQ